MDFSDWYISFPFQLSEMLDGKLSSGEISELKQILDKPHFKVSLAYVWKCFFFVSHKNWFSK